MYNERAFPFAGSDGHSLNDPGMTLRDYFAARVLHGVININFLGDPQSVKYIADHCYNIADAMMEARVKVPTLA
jgi:hypothetical protein